MSLSKKQLQQQEHKKSRVEKEKKTKKDIPLPTRTCMVCGGTEKVSGKPCNVCINGLMF